ncbi:unnamed protein product [Darwinula stevensoni]|uniref:Uncharacterized protein n=1 Tax=Darwinula stevensoni TaxID=69355 RepID=A0A7R9FQX3_9CRUS|nr:unnamed protein product [Darwinula stevensoni]CAG0899960.1 unnamed protein product [Darwinula stevensoni]
MKSYSEVSSPGYGGIYEIPSPGFSVEICWFIPNGPSSSQSVIQATQQQQPSVIQATSGLQAVHFSKGNVILLNTSKSGGVIQSASGNTSIQVVETSDDAEEEAAKKRREILARRPSYRKILNDLSGADIADRDSESPPGSESSQESSTVTITAGAPYQAGLLKVIPASAIQLTSGGGVVTASSSSQDGGLPTLTMSSAGSPQGTTIVQYQGQDGQFFVPVSANELQGYRLQAVGGGGGASGLPSGVVLTSASVTNADSIVEEAARKREVRLLKNREAARECRRKKKEYIKCLENRVAVLENQNKALIEELKSLKELYCQKAE